MTDIEIASTVKLKPITEIAKKLGIDPEVIELYGKYKAKLPLDLIQPARMQGKQPFTTWEISRVAEVLDIPRDQIGAFFFDEEPRKRGA